MASKQTRKSISITGDAYWALKARCEQDGTSMSGVCEGLIRTFLDLPEREAIARAIPRSSARPNLPRSYSPAKDIETVLKDVVIRTDSLGPDTKWVPAKVEAGPVNRVKVIKDAHEAKAAFEKESTPVLTESQKAAAKIFTF